jgi:hypothetical protein
MYRKSRYGTTILPLADLRNERDGADNRSSTTGSVTDKSCIPDLSELDLPDELKARLFEHQAQGVRWLQGVHRTQRGSILGGEFKFLHPGTLSISLRFLFINYQYYYYERQMTWGWGKPSKLSHYSWD